MVAISVATEIDAPPDVVWDDVRNLASHVEWMHDAESIWFTSTNTSGVGATFDCETRVGPIRLTDVMEVTEWVEGSTIGVRHTGIVTGVGAFTLTELPGTRTRFEWNEELTFPWWLGAKVGEVVGGLLLKQIWKRNLVNLRDRFEAGARLR